MPNKVDTLYAKDLRFCFSKGAPLSERALGFNKISIVKSYLFLSPEIAAAIHLLLEHNLYKPRWSV